MVGFKRLKFSVAIKFNWMCALSMEAGTVLSMEAGMVLLMETGMVLTMEMLTMEEFRSRTVRCRSRWRYSGQDGHKVKMTI